MCGQAQNEVKFDFQVKFELEGQGRSLPKIIGILTKVFCVSHPNLVILAWTADELSCGQASDWYTHTHTDTRTDTQTQAMTIPEGQNWPRVKMTQMTMLNYVCHFCLAGSLFLSMVPDIVRWPKIGRDLTIDWFGLSVAQHKMILCCPAKFGRKPYSYEEIRAFSDDGW